MTTSSLSFLSCCPVAKNPDAKGFKPADNDSCCLSVCLPSGDTIKIFALKVLDISSTVAKEAVKVALVVAILYTASSFLPATVIGIGVIEMVVLGPLFEELFFRGMVQNGIWMIQEIYNNVIKGTPPTEEDLETQKTYRIGITALFFGVAHLMNPEPSLIQVTWATWDGIEHGCSMERTHTLATSILDHGMNNGLVAASIVQPLVFVPVLLGVSIYNIVATCKGNLTVGGQIMKGLESVGGCCSAEKNQETENLVFV